MGVSGLCNGVYTFVASDSENCIYTEIISLETSMDVLIQQ